MLALTLLALVGCDSAHKNTTDTAESVPYCEQFSDADTYRIESGDDGSQSGSVLGRLVTDVSTDIHDPQYVGFVDYTLENLDVGGTQQEGQTEPDGTFQEVLGAGNWRFKDSATKPNYACANQIDFVVEPGGTTTVCIDVGCK